MLFFSARAVVSFIPVSILKNPLWLLLFFPPRANTSDTRPFVRLHRITGEMRTLVDMPYGSLTQVRNSEHKYPVSSRCCCSCSLPGPARSRMQPLFYVSSIHCSRHGYTSPAPFSYNSPWC
ncbi:hypothetical protein ACQKWADRAFT_305039, partial [Trichoderma austrokoningii]